MISFNEVRRFLQEEEFVRVTDFAKTLKRRHKNGKLRDKDGKVAATLDNFKTFLRGEGFDTFSDEI